MSQESDVVTVVAAGLGAMTFGADLYYSRICNYLDAELVKPERGGFGTFEQTYERFEARLDHLSDFGRKQLVTIGHSLGGICAVIYAASHPNVLRLVLIGVPVYGSAWLRLIGYVDDIAEQYAPVLLDLMPGSGLLGRFNQSLVQVASISICIEAQFDIFVTPAGACHVPGALGYLRFSAPWVNHVTLITHKRVLEVCGDVVADAQTISASQLASL
jgi:pimeloyl-ACP methyl ester carboxylesterase